MPELPASAPVAGATLHLEHFEASSLATYDPILDMERSAIAQGYGVLK